MTSVFSGGLVRDPGETVRWRLRHQYRQRLTAGPNYVIAYTPNILTITGLVVPQSISFAPAFQIDPLGRPIISVADQAINYYPPFEPFEVKTLDTNVSIKIPTTTTFTTASSLNGLAPGAGGNDSEQDLANLAPAAGGDSNTVAAAIRLETNGEIGCVNNFLDNKPCL